LRTPTTHIAAHPGEVWCWDVTFLPAQIQGRWFYLYLILDLYSRKIVGFEVHDTDSADHAAHLARRTALAEVCMRRRCVRCCTATMAPP
jgi:putative transposase